MWPVSLEKKWKLGHTHTHTEEKPREDPRKMAICKPKWEPLEERSPDDTLVWTSGPHEKIHFCYLSRQVCGTLLWRPNQQMGFLIAFLIVQLGKNLPAMQETWVWFLGQEDVLEKEMAIHSRVLAWRISWTEEPGISTGS